MSFLFKFLSPNTPTNEVTIQEFEKILGVAIPSSYRNFLLETNGGTPLNNAFDVFSPTENLTLYTIIIHKFLGLNAKEDLKKVFAIFKKDLPPYFIPFAIDNFRNLLCMNLKTEEIYFWDCQFRLKPRITPKEKPLLLFIAESFEEFIEKLYHKKN